MSVRHDITAPYTRLESCLYDRLASDAVARLGLAAVDRVRALPPPAAVLDVGCGGGQHALRLAAEGYRVTAVDLSADQIRHAERRARRARTDPAEPPTFLVADAAGLPFEEARFDAVYSVGSIKHWADREAGLRECVRVLRPGGLLVVAEVDRGCRLEDARRWIGPQLGVPWPLRTLGVMAFRTFVAGPSLDLPDAEALAAGLPLDGGRVERLADTPLWILTGRRIARREPAWPAAPPRRPDRRELPRPADV